MTDLIAIVEDEFSLRHNYADLFRAHGYDVTTYATRAAASMGFRRRKPSLALIDIGLEDDKNGGFDLCQEMRSIYPLMPIIFLTARDNDIDKISGLRLNADDYLTKDISLAHLIERVARLLRRTEAFNSPISQSEIFQRGSLKLELSRLNAYWSDKKVDLTLSEFDIVRALARYPGHVKSREQLIKDSETLGFIDPETITSHIKRIRKKFLNVDKKFDAIRTRYGAGYSWNS